MEEFFHNLDVLNILYVAVKMEVVQLMKIVYHNRVHQALLRTMRQWKFVIKEEDIFVLMLFIVSLTIAVELVVIMMVNGFGLETKVSNLLLILRHMKY